MKNNYNLAIIGLGQVGNYLYNEINKKKSDIENKTGKKIKIVSISAKNINKKPMPSTGGRPPYMYFAIQKNF